MRELFLMVVAIVLFGMLLPLFFIQLPYRLYSSNLGSYFYAIAIGLDSLGGSIIYGSELHTISGKCGELSYTLNYWQRPNIVLSYVIDFFFGKNHCYLVAIDEGLILNIKGTV